MDASGSSQYSHTQFLIYRLFSLAGLIPIGGYVVVHLLVNATVVDSPAEYQAQVDKIHSLGMILPLVEWVFIFIPILFHGVVGVYIVSGGLPNAQAYPYARNIRYTLQRATGLVVFAFVIWHVLHMHQLGSGLGGGKFDPEHAASSAAQALAPLPVRVLYLLGVLAAVYHLANGLWTQGITWGLWTSVAAMRRAAFVCAAFGVLLGAVGLSALWGMTNVDIPAARKIEDRMEQHRRQERGEITASAGVPSARQQSPDN